MRMRIVILGAGAVGAVLGLSLEQQKHEVLYLVRPGRKSRLDRMVLTDAASGATRRRDAPMAFELGREPPALEAAGVPARAVPSLKRAALPMLSSGCALLAGWELCGWDAKALARDDEVRGLTADAMREAAQVMRGEAGPLAALLARLPPSAL